MKFSGMVGNGPMNKKLNFDGDPVTIQALFPGYVATGRYGKRLTDINLLLILIRQMAALARRVLTEVCTVPLLRLVLTWFENRAPLRQRRIVESLRRCRADVLWEATAVTAFTVLHSNATEH